MLLYCQKAIASTDRLAGGHCCLAQGAEEARPLGQDVSAQVVDALFHK